MTELTTDQLLEIEKYASYFMTPTDIAYLMGIYPEEFKAEIRKRTSAVSMAYHKGKAEMKIKLHKQEAELALVGSPLAVQNARNNLMDMEDDE